MKPSVSILLWIACTVHFQGASQNMSQAINDYNRNNLIELIELQTDRDTYIAGEIIWFNIHKKSALTNRSLNFSKIVYLELIDSANLPVVQTMVRVEEDCQASALAIPNDISSGNYLLRAYTRWMRNYSEALFSHKELTIINPGQLLVTGVTNNQQETLRLFPEGGGFIAGLENLAGFELSGTVSSKNPAYLVSSKGDTISALKWDESGRGWFSFVPDPGQNYLLKFADGHEQIIKLQYSSAGIRLKAVENNQLSLEVNSTSNESYQLFGVTNGLVVFYQSVPEAGEIQVDLARLPNGKIEFQLMDLKGELVSYRWINNEQEPLSLSISGLQMEYETRDKISMDLEFPGQVEPAMVTISVVKSDLLQEELVTREHDQLLFLAGTGPVVGLLAPGSNRTQYFPETTGHIMEGQVFFDSVSRDEPVVLVISHVGKTAGSQFVIPDKDGRFYFSHNNSGISELVIQALDYADSRHSFQTISSFHNGYSMAGNKSFTLDTAKIESIEQAIINAQTSAIYQNFVASFRNDTTALQGRNFYGQPAYSVDISQYIDLSSIEEVFLELMPFANVRGTGENRYITLTYQNKQPISESPPFILVDGVPIQSVEQLLSTPSDAFVRVDYFNANYMVESINLPGIIHFVRKKADAEFYQTSDNSLRIASPGLQPAIYFVDRIHDSSSLHLPDFRNTLHWQPNVLMEADKTQKVEFYAPDNTGTYTVTITGFTDEGREISQQRNFSVINPQLGAAK